MMNLGLDYKSVIRWGLFVLAFTPLIVFKNLLFPFVFSKALFIRGASVIIVLIVFLYVISSIRRGGAQPLALERLRSPLMGAVLLFVGLNLVSTIVGISPYRSFFGDIERGEGFITLACVLLIVLVCVLFWEQTDWHRFFKLSSLIGIIIAIDALLQFLRGLDDRPDGSFIGNPSFVALYLLFTIATLIMILGKEKRSKVWTFISPIGIAISSWAIFATKTRGALLGMVVGLICALLWIGFKKDALTFSWKEIRINFKYTARILLAIITIFFIVFTLTRLNPIWQNVPGLDRLAQISLSDQTTQTRLINTATGLKSVNPAEVGIVRFLLGWGPEHFNVPYELFYDPTIQQYEMSWFDRAHNRFIDVLVMNGVMGLLSYLYLWFVVFRSIIKKPIAIENREYYFVTVGALFFASAYIFQSLFLFEQIVGYIPLYLFLGYISVGSAAQGSYGESGYRSRPGAKINRYLPAFLGFLSIMMLMLAYFVVFVPYRQATTFMKFVYNTDPNFLASKLDSIVSPYNYAQDEIRQRLVAVPRSVLALAEMKPLVYEVLDLIYQERNVSPSKARVRGGFAYAFTYIGKFYQDMELIKRGEELFREVLKESPSRQEIRYQLASNLVSQGRYDEAREMIFDAIELEPEGLQTNMFYMLIMMPQDWDGSFKTLDLFRATYAVARTPLTHVEAAHYRDAYNNYLASMYRAKDTVVFEKTFVQAIKIEETLREINDLQLTEGIVKDRIETNESAMRAALSLFRVRGFAVVSTQ